MLWTNKNFSRTMMSTTAQLQNRSSANKTLQNKPKPQFRTVLANKNTTLHLSLT